MERSGRVERLKGRTCRSSTICSKPLKKIKIKIIINVKEN